jgi:hypothetical protein
MAAPEQIDGQYANALKFFPTLRQIDLHTYTVIFPEAPEQPFVIALPRDYPNSPPAVTCNNAPVSLPLTDFWVKAFLLEHVVSQLFVIAQAPKTPRLAVTREEIERAVASTDPEALQQESVQQQIAAALPTVAHARQLAEQHSAPGQAAADAAPALEQRVRANCAQLQALLGERHDIRVQLLQLGDPRARALAATQARLREQREGAAARVREIEEQYAAGQMELEPYITAVLEARREEGYYRTVAEMLGQQR